MKKNGAINISEHQMNGGGWYVTGEIDYSWGSNGQFMPISGQADTGKTPKTEIFYTSVKRIEFNVTENLGLIRDRSLSLMSG